MKKFLMSLLLAAGIMLSSGCTDYRTIPVSNVAKVIDNKGVSKEIYRAGKRDIGWHLRYTKQLVLLDTSVETIPLSLKIRLADNQELGVELLVKTQLDLSNEDTIDGMFGSITPISAGEYTSKIPLTLIYGKLGQDLVRRTMVDVITPKTLESFQKDRREVNNTIEQVIRERFANTPLVLLSATINKVEYPITYTKKADDLKAMEMAEELNARKEQAKRARLLEQEQTVAIKQRVELAEAETLRLVNEVTSAGINLDLIEYRKLELEMKRLEVDALMAEAAKASGNSVIFYPTGQKPDYIETKMGTINNK